MSDPSQELPPRLAADFEYIEQLGTGRMSTVVKARDRQSGRLVALKILHQNLVANDAVRRRLRRELAAVRRIDHPAVVRVDDLIETEQTVALVMEFIDGQPLRQHVEATGPMDWEAARAVLADLLAGLGAAHDQGVLHRDLNAEHVLIDRQGRGRIVGFGMARVDALVGLTMHTRVLGALEAMAPERVLGMDYDARADLYSVGAVAYEMLVGHPPIEGTMQAAFARATAPAAQMEQAIAGLPKDARYLLERALVSDTSARFATARQMARALDGDYDHNMWAHWANRSTGNCPGCEAPIIEGLAECLSCGYEFQRLIQVPDGGRWAVQIVAPYDDFSPDVAFEANMEPQVLSEEKVYELMDFLGTYEDTRPLVDGAPEYQHPPYILFDGLVEEDARRIEELLTERGFLTRVDAIDDGGLRHSQLSKRHNYTHIQDFGRDIAGQGNPVLADILRFSVGGVAWAIVAALLIVQTRSLMLVTTITVTFGLVFWRTRAALRPGELMAIDAEGAHRQIRRLTGRSRQGRDLLPAGTIGALQSLRDETLLREFYELIILSLDLRNSLAAPGQAKLDEILADIVATVVATDEALAELASLPVTDILDELETLEKIDDDPSGDLEISGEDSPRRQALLDQLAARDEAVHRVTTAKARLLMARGALLDLRARGERQELSQSDEATETLDEVHIVLESATEVEAELVQELT